MQTDKRKIVRFADVGRIDALEICVFPGVLLDISQGGCKSRFPYSREFNLDCDYELRIFPAHKRTQRPFLVIGQPRWQRQEGQATEIGFEFLHSPGIKALTVFLDTLELEQRNPAEEMIIETVCEFRQPAVLNSIER
jgi:hypothetical protein